MIITKSIKVVAVSTILALIIISVWYASNQLSANPESLPSNSPPLATPTLPLTSNTNPPTSPTPSSNTPSPTSIVTNPPATSTPAGSNTPISTPTPNPTVPPTTTIATFDFDTGTPTVVARMGTPFIQTKDGISAQFSSPSDPAAFSIQTYSTTFIKLSQFQGNYLSDNLPQREILEIRFNQSLSSVTFTFATIESEGLPGDLPSNITLTAYMDSIATPIGSTIARGTWPTGGDAYPQGTLTYNSGNQPFNLVRIELPYQGPKKAVDYLIDTITVKTI